MTKSNAFICTNCSHSFTGRYCPNCGQPNDDYKRPLLNLLSEFITDLFGADSHILRTIPALIARPGFLSREFREGRRMRYSSPLRLYLALSLFTFLILSFGNVGLLVVETTLLEGEEIESVPEFLRMQEGASDDQIIFLQIRALARIEKPDPVRIQKLKEALAKEEPTQLVREVERISMAAADDPVAFNRVLNDYLAILFLLQVIVIAGVNWAILWNRFPYPIDHITFALHIGSFGLVFLIVVVGIAHLIPPAWTTWLYGLAYWPLLGVYWFLALKHNFNLTIWGTIWRFLVISIFQVIGGQALASSAVWLAARTV